MGIRLDAAILWICIHWTGKIFKTYTLTGHIGPEMKNARLQSQQALNSEHVTVCIYMLPDRDQSSWVSHSTSRSNELVLNCARQYPWPAPTHSHAVCPNVFISYRTGMSGCVHDSVMLDEYDDCSTGGGWVIYLGYISWHELSGEFLWFNCGSTMVQLLFNYGSTVVQLWFNCGLTVV